MKKLLIALLLPITLLANPFGEPEPQELNLPQQIMQQLNQAQKDLKSQMSSMVREYKDGGSPLSLLMLLGLSFAYGILHAAGPGHGKTVVLGYLLSRKGDLKKGILMGSLAAFMHGISAIVVVSIIYKLSLGRMTATFDSISARLMAVSYSMIILIGLYLLISALRRKEQKELSRLDGLAMVTSIGLLPCPGTMIILLFFMAMQLMGLGIIMGLSMALGMGLTVALIATIGSGTKKITHDNRIQKGLEICGALLVIGLGSLLLLANR